MIQPQSHLRKLYRSSETSEDRKSYIGLDRNERVTPLQSVEFGGILRTFQPELLCHYPDPSAFYKQLSKTVHLPSSYLYATAGSDAAIRMIFHTFVRPGDTVIFPTPSYAMYNVYGQIFRGTIVTLPYNETFRFNLDRLYRLLQRRPRLVVIANPDQPTGSTLSQSLLLAIVRAAQKRGTLVVIDEAYHPFYPKSMIEQVRRFDNLIVTRSFSKAAGLAGLRLGFMAAQPSLINWITRVRGAFEVNAVAFACGTYLLKHPAILRNQMRKIEEGRAVLIRWAATHGIEFPACPTNFQLLRFPGLTQTERLVALLKKKRFLIKGSFSVPGLRNCIRVTLAGPRVMRPFCAALQSSLRTIRWKNQ